jgi:hypothetical protein
MKRLSHGSPVSFQLLVVISAQLRQDGFRENHYQIINRTAVTAITST